MDQNGIIIYSMAIIETIALILINNNLKSEINIKTKENLNSF